jgi:Fur family ferric uptake transcriptional regulator
MATPGKHNTSAQSAIDDNLAYLADRLRAIGQRATPQRLMILGALETGEHLTADEVYCRIAGLSPVINRSTVYRTLELFRDLGVVSETDLGSGVRQFELLDQHRHHHLVCHECGAIIDIDDSMVEPLRRQALQRHGFAADIDHLALFGRCRTCAGG